MEEFEENKIEEKKASQIEKAEEKPKLKIHWFDYVAFFNIWLLITSLPLLNDIEKAIKNNIKFEQNGTIAGLALLMLNIISAVIIMAFGLKNNETLKKNRIVLLISKKPLVAQIYGTIFLLTYLLVIKLLFKSIF